MWNYLAKAEPEMKFRVENYKSEPLCLALYKADDPMVPVTMNLGHFVGPGRLMPEYMTYLNASHPEFARVKEFVEAQQIGHPVLSGGRPVVRESGFHAYPLYAFDPEKLRAMDPKGCSRYEQTYRIEAYTEQMAEQLREEVRAKENAADDPIYW